MARRREQSAQPTDIEAVRPGDEAARPAVEHHLALADTLARQYAHRGIDLDDLVQVARLGLVLAAERFRPGLGSCFEAFAVPTIRGELRRHFRDHGWTVRPPRRIQELRARTRQARTEFEQVEGREPTATDLAGVLRVSALEIDECAAAESGYSPLSLDAEAGDHRTPLCERLGADDEGIDSLPDQLTLHRELRHLTARERRILAWRFWEELTQEQIAARLGVSQMQVSRLLSGILARLRTSFLPAAAS